MTEEQRWRQEMGALQDRNTCLKGIWEELRNIVGMLKILTTVSPTVANGRFTEEDAKALRTALKQPAQFVPTVKETPEPPKPSFLCKEKIADVLKYEDYANALDNDWEKTGDYRDAKFNGEWHGEQIDPSDPANK